MGLIVVSSLLVTLLPYSALITAQPIEHQNSTTQRFMEAALHARERTYQLRELLMEKIGSKYMKLILDKHPQVVEYALEAVDRTGIKPIKNLIRGGTDGARLCYMGVPTPNVFTGGHNFHSKKEWVSVQDMAKAVETIIHLSQIWAEKNR